jgi:hypothetical protein
MDEFHDSVSERCLSLSPGDAMTGEASPAAQFVSPDLAVDYPPV